MKLTDRIQKGCIKFKKEKGPDPIPASSFMDPPPPPKGDGPLFPEVDNKTVMKYNENAHIRRGKVGSNKTVVVQDRLMKSKPR